MKRRDFLKIVGVYSFSNFAFPIGKESFYEKRENKKNFIFYDQLNFNNRPTLIEKGLKPISVYYADQLWPNREKGENIDRNYIFTKYSEKEILGSDGLLCLDIEHWPYRRVSSEELDITVGKYVELLNIFRDIYPTARIGFFEFGPTSFYPLLDQFAEGEKDAQLYKQWIEEQEKLSPIYEKVDVLFPQLYSRWPNSVESWENTARLVLEKARLIAKGKPVIPFIWPQFWKDSYEIIPGQYWKGILDTVYQLADSAVIWSIYRGAPNWDEDFEWWEVTEEFINNLNPPKAGKLYI